MSATNSVSIRVGVGGWTFEPWRDNFYPEGWPQSRELEYASRRLSAIEVNGTYYGLQKAATFAKWRDETPDDFVFSLKASRYATLETRRSGDGSELWLNWVLRERSASTLIGYVQATVHADGHALVAYELGSTHWGRGLGSEAVTALIDELGSQYGAHTVLAIFKRSNRRSRRLLEGLGFASPDLERALRWPIEADEDLLLRQAAATPAEAPP